MSFEEFIAELFKGVNDPTCPVDGIFCDHSTCDGCSCLMAEYAKRCKNDQRGS